MYSDDQMFKWLFSSHTKESLEKANQDNVQPELTLQDRCLSDLSCWYNTLDSARSVIEQYMQDAKVVPDAS